MREVRAGVVKRLHRPSSLTRPPRRLPRQSCASVALFLERFLRVTGAAQSLQVVALPEPDGVATVWQDAAEQFDYVEHLLLGLESVTYYGRRQ